MVVVGRVGAPYGVKGWVKIHAFTEPFTNLATFSPWYLSSRDGWQEIHVSGLDVHGDGLIAQFEDCPDRDQARRYTNLEIAVAREQLPEPESDEYYWHDLIGLTVYDLQDKPLGVVNNVLATGSHDVLVVRLDNKEFALPFRQGEIIKEIDLDDKRLIADWEPLF